MTLIGFLRGVAAPAALGVVSVYVMQFVKFLWPKLEDRLAVAVSIVVALFVGITANELIPIVPQLPAWVNGYWPYVMWAAQQLWFQVVVKKRIPPEKRVAPPVPDNS